MFRSIAKKTQIDQKIEVEVNGVSIEVAQGSSVWNAMALAGQLNTRLAPVSEQTRSAYCAMGVCFECLVEIDGMPNQQACMTRVRPGMKITQQQITMHTQASLENDSAATVQQYNPRGQL